MNEDDDEAAVKFVLTEHYMMKTRALQPIRCQRHQIVTREDTTRKQSLHVRCANIALFCILHFAFTTAAETMYAQYFGAVTLDTEMTREDQYNLYIFTSYNTARQGVI